MNKKLKYILIGVVAVIVIGIGVWYAMPEKNLFNKVGNIYNPPSYANGMTITNATTNNTISVDQNGNVGTDVRTDGAIWLENSGNTGVGIGAYTNINGDMDQDLIYGWVDNPLADKKVMTFKQDGTDAGVEIDMNGTPTNGYDPALYLNVAHTSANAGALFIIDNSNAYSVNLDKNASSTSRQYGMKIDVDNSHPSSGGVCAIDFSAMTSDEPVFKFIGTTTAATKSPETDSQDTWIPILIGTTLYYIPAYKN